MKLAAPVCSSEVVVGTQQLDHEITAPPEHSYYSLSPSDSQLFMHIWVIVHRLSLPLPSLPFSPLIYLFDVVVFPLIAQQSKWKSFVRNKLIICSLGILLDIWFFKYYFCL